MAYLIGIDREHHLMDHDLQKALAAEVRRRRHARSMTTVDLGEQASVDGTTISRLENEKSQVTLDVAAKVSRALGIRLQDLRMSDTPIIANTAVDESARYGISSSDVDLLLTLYRQDPAAVDELFARWLGDILDRVALTKRDIPPPAMLQEQLRLIQADHDVLDYDIRYPRGRELSLLVEGYRLGGVLSKEDLSLLLSVIQSQSAYLDDLDRQGRDTLIRLQANMWDRVRLIDVERIGDILHLDLLGMYWSTLGLGDRFSGESDEREVHQRGRLISMFVLLTAWLEETSGAGEDWLSEVRRDLEARQTA